jgi:hypothetical protein
MLYFHTEYKKNKATYRVDQSIIGHAGFFGQIRICYIPSSSSDSASTMHVIIYWMELFLSGGNAIFIDNWTIAQSKLVLVNILVTA